MDIWAQTAVARRQLASYLRELDEAAWDRPTLCSGWRVREVVGHIVTPLTVSLPAIMVAMIRERGSVDRTADRLARSVATRSSTDLIEALELHAEKRFTPPGYPPQTALFDVTVHRLDICWPVGERPEIDADVLRTALDFVTSGRDKALTPKGRFAGLRLEAADAEWSWGDGDLVRGPVQPLLLAMTGRSEVLDSLSGDGVRHLRARLRAGSGA